MRTNKTHQAVLFLLLFPAISLAQTSAKTNGPKAARPTTASLSGKAFAITKGGDVKPALLAHLYLFSAKDPIRPYIIGQYARQDKDEKKLRGAGMGEPGLESLCRAFLYDLDKAVADDFKGTFILSAQHATGPFSPTYTTDTDETGAFSISDIEPGDYLVVVRGQAGSNDVLWIETVTLVSGEAKTLKLSSVKQACPLE